MYRGREQGDREMSDREQRERERERDSDESRGMGASYRLGEWREKKSE